MNKTWLRSLTDAGMKYTAGHDVVICDDASFIRPLNNEQKGGGF